MMNFFIMIGKLLRFFYYWFLFFMSTELIYRRFFLQQKPYQVSEVWIYVAVVLNGLLIANYFRKVFKERTTTKPYISTLGS